MPGKHDWIEISRYFEIHGTAMVRLEQNGYVLSDDLAVAAVTAGLLMEGRIRCVGGLLIDVTKLLEQSAEHIKTKSYTYHVQVEGIGNLFRYCSPHADEIRPDHKPFHHKHTFDILNGDTEGAVSQIDEANWPTLAEVIIEACEWFYENGEEVEALRSRE